MNIDPSAIWEALECGIQYLPVTLELALVSFVISVILGAIIAAVRTFHIPFLAAFFEIAITLLKGIPAILIVYILYFVCLDGINPVLKNEGIPFQISLNAIGILGLSVFGTPMASENIRGALNSVETGQFEAGYSIGMTRRQVLLRIVLPQAIPTAVPPLCSSLIGLIKGSSLCYMLMIMEVLNGTLLVASRSYKYLEAYIAAALIFWFLCICFEQLGRLLTKKINTYQKGIG